MSKCQMCGKTVPPEKLQRIDSGEEVCAGCLAEMRKTSKKSKPALLARLRTYCQMLVLWLGIGSMVVMCLFPPWIVFTEGYTRYKDGKIDSHVVSNRESVGYHYIFTPPSMTVHPSPETEKRVFDMLDRTPDWALATDILSLLGLKSRGQCYLDISRLVVQCILVALLTAGGIYSLRPKR